MEGKDLIELGLAALSILGSIIVYLRQTNDKKRILKLETEEEKKKLIQKYQFEKEFKVYEKLWETLVELSHKVASLKPIVEYVDIAKTEDERRKEKMDAFNLAMNNLGKEYMYNKPFYSSKIYQAVTELMQLGTFEAIDFSLDTTREHKTAQENVDKIVNQLDHISTLIKERILFIEDNIPIEK